MATDSTQVRIGANGEVFVAPVGTTGPADATEALDAAFIGLGLVNDEGVTVRVGQEITDINAWQEFYPVRKVVTARSFQIAGSLIETDPDVVSFATGGGDFTDLGAGEASYVPPAPEVIDERAVVLEWLDGATQYRLYVPRGLVTGEAEITISRTGAIEWPFQFDATPTGVDDPWTLLISDDAFETVSS